MPDKVLAFYIRLSSEDRDLKTNVSILRTSIKCYKSKLFKLRIWCRTQTAFPDADNQLPSKYRRWKRDDLSR